MTGEARKRQIVQVALKTIGKHGVHGTTISRIAKGAGITTAALYTHFENREAILLAALDAVYEQILDCHRSASSVDAIERIREICGNYEKLVTAGGTSGHAHLHLEFVAGGSERALREAVNKKDSVVTATWVQLVEEGQRQGSIAQDVDSQEVALMIGGWAWSGNVALLMGHRAAWHPRLASRQLERILEDISSANRPTACEGPSSDSSAAPAKDLVSAV
jgi:AcrR family transcriptional regulator